MEFVRASSEQGVNALVEQLRAALASGRSVLWLISGGSNITLEVQIMANLPAELAKDLAVMLSDERYGPPGHENSNFAQLERAGFNAKKASFFPVLTGEGLTQTTLSYAELAQQQFAKADLIIGQLGIGADGHVAGILPGSPAVSASALVASYQGPDFTRISLTFKALAKASVVFAFAYGQSKHGALTRLASEKLPLDTQPAQILNSINESYIYNDQIKAGGNL